MYNYLLTPTIFWFQLKALVFSHPLSIDETIYAMCTSNLLSLRCMHLASIEIALLFIHALCRAWTRKTVSGSGPKGLCHSQPLKLGVLPLHQFPWAITSKRWASWAVGTSLHGGPELRRAQRRRGIGGPRRRECPPPSIPIIQVAVAQDCRNISRKHSLQERYHSANRPDSYWIIKELHMLFAGNLVSDNFNGNLRIDMGIFRSSLIINSAIMSNDGIQII